MGGELSIDISITHLIFCRYEKCHTSYKTKCHTTYKEKCNTIYHVVSHIKYKKHCSKKGKDNDDEYYPPMHYAGYG